MRDEVDHGLEGLVSGETDGDFPFSRRNQERFPRSVKLSHMAEEETVNEYRRPDRLNVQLDFRGVFPVWVLDLEVLCHGHAQGLLLSWLYHDFLDEILVPGLAHHDFVLSWQKQDLLCPIQFLEVAQVLAIDPYSRGFLDFRCAFEMEFSQHFVSCMQGPGEGREGAQDQHGKSKFDAVRTHHGQFSLPSTLTLRAGSELWRSCRSPQCKTHRESARSRGSRSSD